MYQEISTEYCNYIKLYIKLCLKIAVLQCERSKMKEEVLTVSSNIIMEHQKHFMIVIGKIMDQLNQSGFCRQTRLFSNYIFVLMKDLVRLYKVLEVYNLELIARFEALIIDQQAKSIELLKAFLKTTATIKKRSEELVAEFEFPKELLPKFYVEEEGLLDTLVVLMESNKEAPVADRPEVVRKPIKKEERKIEESKDEHKDEEVYFKCSVLEGFSDNIVFDKVNPNPPQKLDAQFDLMDFISKSDFTSVNGAQSNPGFDMRNTGPDKSGGSQGIYQLN